MPDQNPPQSSNPTEGAGQNAEPVAGQQASTPNAQNPTEGQQQPVAPVVKDVTMSQEAFDAIITGRLNKQQEKLEKTHNASIADLNGKLAVLQSERDAFATEITASVKTEFDALPEEIRSVQTADINTPEGLKSVREWLPKAKELAAKLASPAPAGTGAVPPVVKPTPVPGNVGDPNPASQSGQVKTLEELVKEAEKTSIYRTF